MSIIDDLKNFNDELQASELRELAQKLLLNKTFWLDLPNQLKNIAFDEGRLFLSTVMTTFNYFEAALRLDNTNVELASLRSDLLELFFQNFELPSDSMDEAPGAHQEPMWLLLYAQTQSLEVIQKNKARISEIISIHEEHPYFSHIAQCILHLLHRVVTTPHPQEYESLYTLLKKFKKQESSLPMIISIYEAIYQIKQRPALLIDLLEKIAQFPSLSSHIQVQLNQIQVLSKLENDSSDLSTEKIITALQLDPKKNTLKIQQHQHTILFLLACAVVQPSDDLSCAMDAAFSMLQKFSQSFKKLNWTIQKGDDFSEVQENQIDHCLTLLECLVLLPPAINHPYIYNFKCVEIKTLLVSITNILEKSASTERKIIGNYQERLDGIQKRFKDTLPLDSTKAARMLLIEECVSELEDPRKKESNPNEYARIKGMITAFPDPYPQTMCVTQWLMRMEQAQSKCEKIAVNSSATKKKGWFF